MEARDFPMQVMKQGKQKKAGQELYWNRRVEAAGLARCGDVLCSHSLPTSPKVHESNVHDRVGMC